MTLVFQRARPFGVGSVTRKVAPWPGSLDSDTVDIEQVRHHGRVLFCIAFAVSLGGPIGDAAIVFFPLGRKLALIREGSLQQLVGIRQRCIRRGLGVLRVARIPACEKNECGNEENDGVSKHGSEIE